MNLYGSVPYLRKNPCQEEVLTRWHHGFSLIINPAWDVSNFSCIACSFACPLVYLKL